MSIPQITVIIPTWNGRELLRACLTSLRAQTCRTFTVIVVDNASTDGTMQMLRSDFPEVTGIPLERNLGFGAAVNTGLRIAATPYIFLLNNDTIAEPECLDKLLERMSVSGPRCAGVQCRMMNYFKPAIIDTLGLGMRMDRFGTIEFMDLAHGDTFSAAHHGTAGNLIGVCAGAAFYRRAFFDEQGLLDERFFAIYEDVDLSLRGIRRGWHFMYEPQAVVLHHKSPSLAKLEYRKRLETTKNYYYAAYKNLPVKMLRGLTIKLLYSLQMDVFNFIAHRKHRRYLSTLRMYAAILRFLPSMLAERQTTIASREYQALCQKSIEKGIW